MQTALTIGTFDPFHAGHADLLRWCYMLAGHVTVGVLSDEFVEKAKGQRPKLSETARRTQFRTLSDETYIERGKLDRLIHPDRITLDRPDFVVVGGDWHERDYLARLGLSQRELDLLDISVVYTPRIGISSTQIKLDIG